MVLRAYSIEHTLVHCLLSAQLTQEEGELGRDSACLVEEVPRGILDRLHLFSFYVGEHSQVVAGALLGQNNHVCLKSGGNEAGRLTFQRGGLQLPEGLVLQFN